MSKTPPKGVRQSAEDRDLAAMKERRASSQSEGTPQEFAEEDATAPVTLVERGELQHEKELHIIQKEYERNPAYRALWNMMRRQRRESNRTMGTVADAANQVHQDLSGIKEITDKLQNIADWKHEVDIILKIMKWLLGVVFVAAIGSIVVVATKIYTWGVSSGELEIRLQHLERSIERRNPQSFPAIIPNNTTREP